MNVLRGETLGAGRRVAIVASRFNELVTTKLVEGACAGLSHHGVVPEDVTVAWVPGAFEIPVAAKQCAASGALLTLTFTWSHRIFFPTR